MCKTPTELSRACAPEKGKAVEVGAEVFGD
jgi:hypothetical protein